MKLNMLTLQEYIFFYAKKINSVTFQEELIKRKTKLLFIVKWNLPALAPPPPPPPTPPPPTQPLFLSRIRSSSRSQRWLPPTPLSAATVMRNSPSSSNYLHFPLSQTTPGHLTKLSLLIYRCPLPRVILRRTLQQFRTWVLCCYVEHSCCRQFRPKVPRCCVEHPRFCRVEHPSYRQ